MNNDHLKKGSQFMKLNEVAAAYVLLSQVYSSLAMAEMYDDAKAKTRLSKEISHFNDILVERLAEVHI